MAKANNAAAAKPRVVFDLKMPRYQYRQGDGKLSPDRKGKLEDGPKLDCLANLKAS